jgi:dihydroorotase
MVLEKLQNLELPASADMHVHLRDGSMMNLVVPKFIRQGGVNTVMVMVLSYPPPP